MDCGENIILFTWLSLAAPHFSSEELCWMFSSRLFLVHSANHISLHAVLLKLSTSSSKWFPLILWFLPSPILSVSCIIFSLYLDLSFCLSLSSRHVQTTYCLSSSSLCSLISSLPVWSACPDIASEVAGSTVGSQDTWVTQKLSAQTNGGWWTEYSYLNASAENIFCISLEVQLISVFFCVAVGSMDSRGGRSRNVDLNMTGE